MEKTNRVAGAVQIIGPQPQPPAAAAAAISSALYLASIDARLANFDPNNVRLADGTTVRIANDPLNPVPVRGLVALDPSEPMPLPSNAARESGGNLAALLARTPAPGPAAMAASSPVTIALDQAALAFNLSAAAEDGHLRALRDIATAHLRATLADIQQRAAMAGAFIPIPEV